MAVGAGVGFAVAGGFGAGVAAGAAVGTGVAVGDGVHSIQSRRVRSAWQRASILSTLSCSAWVASVRSMPFRVASSACSRGRAALVTFSTVRPSISFSNVERGFMVTVTAVTLPALSAAVTV